GRAVRVARRRPIPAGLLRGILVFERGQPDRWEKGLAPPPAFLACKPHPLQAVKDVGADRFPRKQRKMLEDDASIRARSTNRSALDENPAGFRGQKAADQIEKRRLATA